MSKAPRPASSPEAKGQFLVYEAEDGRIKINVRLADETVWLTQAQMAELFQTSVPNVSIHIKNVFDEGELTPDATLKKFLTVRREGSREVQRNLDHYNLDMKRADADKPNMGLTNWRGAMVRKQDVTIAKNYLDEAELAALNNLVEQYLVFAEGQAMRRIPMHMQDWINKLDAFLNINDREILTHAGKVSHEMARELAEAEYDRFNRKRISEQDRTGNAFDKMIERFPKAKTEKKP